MTNVKVIVMSSLQVLELRDRARSDQPDALVFAVSRAAEGQYWKLGDARGPAGHQLALDVRTSAAATLCHFHVYRTTVIWMQ